MDDEKAVSVNEFLSASGQIVDLRTPKEFEKGHIPNAINIPIFSDEERREVGKVFKLQGPFKATQLGLKYTGPKLSEIVTQLKETKKKPIGVYCARGGMRSQAMVWLLNFCRIPALSLRRGYKDYRQWVLNAFSKDYQLNLLQSFLGSTKVDPKEILKKRKEQFLDLEKIANFPIYEFSSQESLNQPSCEHFENLLAHHLLLLDLKRPIWLPYAGKSLGNCKIPTSFFKQFRASNLFLLKDDKKDRIEVIKKRIEGRGIGDLVQSFEGIQKKLGTLRYKRILQAACNNENEAVAEAVLDYFDKVAFFYLKKHKGSTTSFFRML
ncbi:MAG: tRNA 2-selenouridine synthase [Chlamydiae bacterium]|nr:tRNA 2-selenouridine synthase [Chlamydiota bacterium]